MMVAHFDQLLEHAPDRELTRAQLRWLHNQASYIVATFREFFPEAPRPAECPTNAPKAKPGTLAAFMQTNGRSGMMGAEKSAARGAQTPGQRDRGLARSPR